MQAIPPKKPEQLPGKGRSEIRIGGKEYRNQPGPFGVQLALAVGQPLEGGGGLAEGVGLLQRGCAQKQGLGKF